MTGATRAPGWKTLLAVLLLLSPVIVGLILGWGRESRQEKAAKNAWTICQDKILTAWALRDRERVRERLKLVDDYLFGWDSTGLSNEEARALKEAFDWRDRTRAAAELGMSERELIQLDENVRSACGPFPKYRDQLPSGRERVR